MWFKDAFWNPLTASMQINRFSIKINRIQYIVYSNQQNFTDFPWTSIEFNTFRILESHGKLGQLSILARAPVLRPYHNRFSITIILFKSIELNRFGIEINTIQYMTFQYNQIHSCPSVSIILMLLLSVNQSIKQSISHQWNNQ